MASLANVTKGRLVQMVRVKKEPEGAVILPDRKFVHIYVRNGVTIIWAFPS